jgi:hypothetical protein
MKEIWNRSDRIQKKEWEIERKIKKDVIVFEIVIFILDKTVIRNPKSLLYRRHVT